MFEVAEEAIRIHRAAFGERSGARRRARRRRRVRLPRARRGAHVDARRDRQAAALDAQQQLRDLQGVRADHQRPVAAAHDVPRAVRVPVRPRAAGADRGGRAGHRDRQALRHRRHVARLDLDRGAHHARDRDEPHRRQVEHRRGRRGPQALRAGQGRRDAGRRASAATASSATSRCKEGDSLKSKIKQVASGRFGVTAEYLASRRADPDQDGAGRQARRGRPAARAQGVRVHRRAALLDAGRGADLAAAAPRHLLDRGSGAADPRPEERQPDARRSA